MKFGKKMSLSTFNKRSFWISMVGGFMMAFFQMNGFANLDVFKFNKHTPIESASTKFETEIMPLLQKVPNSFKLSRQSNNAPIAYAGTAYGYDNASAYALVNLDTGEVIESKNGDEKISIASLTKVMTVIVALDLADPEEEFTVSKRASAQIPTKIGVVAGQRMKLSELISASMLTSANDAVEVIREGIDHKYGGSVFIDAMNRKAQILGLSHTHFSNPQGFDNVNHYSTPFDLAVLTGYALENYPLLAEIAKRDYEFLSANASHKQFDLYNWNGLIGVYPSTTGLKIGNTEDAGKTTIVVSQRGGTRLGAVLLGAPGILERDLWVAELLDTGYEKTRNMKRVAITEEDLQAKYATWNSWN